MSAPGIISAPSCRASPPRRSRVRSVRRPANLIVAVVAVGLARNAAPIPSPGELDSAQAVETLAAMPGPQALRSAYTLAVVDVPEPPADLMKPAKGNEGAAPSTRPPVRGRSRCPVDVRAIVIGDGTAFTIVGASGTGASGSRAAESKLLRVGEGVRAAGGWLALTSIGPDHVVLRRGDRSYRCRLQTPSPEAQGG